MIRRLSAILCGVVIVLLAACGGGDAPPDDGSPEPPALAGVYSCVYGSLTFNGDGRSVAMDFTGEFAALSGLPSDQSEGTYVFLFHNEEWRYDKAEYFRVMLDGESFQFRNALGETSENTVAFFLDGGETVKFEKEG